MEGVTHGFYIVDPLLLEKYVEIANYKSATNPYNKPLVEKQINNELANNRFKKVNYKPKIISALGAVPKAQPNSVRLILDCSRPAGSAVNDFATNDKFQYQSLQDAIDNIKPNYYLAKIDLANAYRSVKIHPSNHCATGMKWKFSREDEWTYLVDCALPFGASRSPLIFHELGQAVRRMATREGWDPITVFLDDFLITSPTFSSCLKTMNNLMSLLRKLGFAINYNKVIGPKQKLTFLGIIIDTCNMTMELPPDKIEDLKTILFNIRTAHKANKKKLQSLAGKLNWASQCIYGGRFHLRRILDVITHLKAPTHRVRITRAMKADIDWWLNFMQLFNGSTPIVDSNPAISITTDACPIAAGAVYGNQYVYTPWSSWKGLEADLPINYLEVLALEPAVQAWGPEWRDHTIYVHCDNMAAVAIINKGSCRNPTVMASLRRIFWWSAVCNFRLKAKFYPGISNVWADTVSRLHEFIPSIRQTVFNPITF